MRDRPTFDSTEPVTDDELTPEERATVVDGMLRRRELQAAEGEIPDVWA